MSAAEDLVTVKINRLRAEKSQYVNAKKDAELEISRLNARVRGNRLPPREYNEICGKQARAMDAVREAERKMQALSLKIIELADVDREQRSVAKAERGTPAEVMISGLITLQDKYMRFSEESTRVNSMRLMAGSFAKELTELIRLGKQA